MPTPWSKLGVGIGLTGAGSGAGSGAGAGAGAVGEAVIRDVYPPSVAATYILLGVVALSTFLLTPLGRKAASRLVPIDPAIFRHGMGLSLLTLLALSSTTPLLVAGDISSAGAVPLPSDAAPVIGAGAASMVYELLWFVPLAFMAAGWPRFRTTREACARLGLGRPGHMRAVVGVLAGMLLAVLAAFALDPLVRWIWDLAGWHHSDTAPTGRSFSWAMTPFGALLVSVTAGIGEELLVRGLLQPRFGLIVSNLAFAAMHASGYGWDGLLTVWILGVALGALRARTDTTTVMFAHTMYDFTTLLALSRLR
jgi:membrane protease YdiL (CAAX protease family)